jgi:hypothetical protein
MIVIKDEHLPVVLAGLGELKYKVAAPVMQDIYRQLHGKSQAKEVGGAEQAVGKTGDGAPRLQVIGGGHDGN